MPTNNELKNDLRIQRDYLIEIKNLITENEPGKAIDKIDMILHRINESLQD